MKLAIAENYKKNKMVKGGPAEDFRVDGYMTLSNSGGIEIELDNSGDGLRYRFNNNGTYTEPEETFIGFDEDGEAMFVDGDTVYHLSDFMRAYAKGCMMAKGGSAEEYRKGGNITSIEKRVAEVNEMIKKGNELGIEVIDESGTWQAPMKYKPIKYSNGILYIEYDELDLYKHNKGQGSFWKTEKLKVLKSEMSLRSYETGAGQKEALSDIAKMYRKALNHYEKYGYYAKGGGVGTEFTRFKNWFDNYKHKYGAKLINQRKTFMGAGTRSFGDALFSITGTEPFEEVYPSNAEAQDFVSQYNSGDKMKRGGEVGDYYVKYDKFQKMWVVFKPNGTPVDEYTNKHNAIGVADNLNQKNKMAKGGGVGDSSLYLELSDIDNTRVNKWMNNHFDSESYDIKKSGKGYVIDTNKLSKKEVEDLKYYLKSQMKRGGGVGDDQLNVVFSRQDMFEKAKDFYENESGFYPSDVNDEFRTFVFDIENGEADVTEYYLEQELQETDLDGYYFEIADKMKQGGRAYNLGLKVGSLLNKTKQLGRKGVDATKKAVRDKQKKIALNVIDDTKDKVSDNKRKMILKGAEEIVDSKYKRGGGVDSDELELKKMIKSQQSYINEFQLNDKEVPYVETKKLIDLEKELADLKSYAKGGPTKAQAKKVGKVMHEWKAGKLHSGSKKGPIVTDQKQAVAIALSEAGISKKEEGGQMMGWKHKTKK